VLDASAGKSVGFDVVADVRSAYAMIAPEIVKGIDTAVSCWSIWSLIVEIAGATPGPVGVGVGVGVGTAAAEN
jgi:hypothetical protein